MSENETRDAERVDQALAALDAGDSAVAAALLLGVIANTPAEYVNASENSDGDLVIKFWDQQAFVHYIMWQKQQGGERAVRWVGNAYPRAYYYMGFLCVQARRYKQALEYLERGRQLEPTNPHFTFEKAQALLHSREKESALALYDAANEIGPYVSGLDVALAKRGRGAILIEWGRFDEAEEAFKSSLEIEHDNPLALNELKYIAHLRKGGSTSPMEVVETQTSSLTQCVACGSTYMTGTMVEVEGVPQAICAKCKRKYSKRWWKFWK